MCSGFEQFLIDLKDYVCQQTGVVMEKIHHRPASYLYQVSTTGRNAWIVNDWLRQDGLGLPRKQFAPEVVARYRG